MEDAQKLLGAWVQAWGQMGGLPELFDMAAKERHPLHKVPRSVIKPLLAYTLYMVGQQSVSVVAPTSISLMLCYVVGKHGHQQLYKSDVRRFCSHCCHELERIDVVNSY